MEGFLFVCMLVVLLVRWFQMRSRLATIEARLDALWERAYRMAVTVEEPPPTTAPSPPQPMPAPRVEPRPSAPPEERVYTPPPPQEELPVAVSAPEPEPHPHPSRTSEEWEALLGGSWLNKVGVFVVVIGIALLLNYAYTHIGPAGRVAIGHTGALAMLIAGVVVERREKYRTFAYGLIGGGWAALYLTTYAMHAVEAARVLDNALAAVVLLLAVAVGMIVHSLRYRSETVTGLAYFVAFVTLAVGEVTAFSVVALIPLAGSLLYVAHRNRWSRFAVFGLIATYATVALHKDAGSPLWQAQTIFLIYWVLFEGFDLIRADAWLLPLNACGFLLLSGVKWSHAAPESMWMFAAGSAVLYLGGTVVRARSGRWRPAVTLNAVLATAAIVLKLEHQWVAVGLLLLAETYYLAGVRFRSGYLRAIAGGLFGLELLDLAVRLVPGEAAHTWEPVAAATAVAFYLNRALRPADQFYGYLGAGLAALVSGYEANGEWRGRVWMLMAAVPFSFGWWRRQFDFRMQAYGLGILGAAGTAWTAPLPVASLAVGAVLAYGLVLCALRDAERWSEVERETARTVASAAVSAALTALVWRLVPGAWLGTAWLALSWLLLEAGQRDWPKDFRNHARVLAALGAVRALTFDTGSTFALADAALLYGMAWRSVDLAAYPATLLLMVGLNHVLPRVAVTMSWAMIAVVLGEFDRRHWRVQSIVASAAVFARAVTFDLSEPTPAIAIAPAILCIEGAMLRRPLGTRLRLYFSLLGAALAAVLIFHEVSGSVLTIAWGIEGVALLAAGFPLGDRVLRLSGLALLAVCTAKLFFWDLRNLDTLPRIVSFIVLGLLLVAVSWIYTRYRDQVKRIL